MCSTIPSNESLNACQALVVSGRYIMSVMRGLQFNRVQMDNDNDEEDDDNNSNNRNNNNNCTLEHSLAHTQKQHLNYCIVQRLQKNTFASSRIRHLSLSLKFPFSTVSFGFVSFDIHLLFCVVGTIFAFHTAFILFCRFLYFNFIFVWLCAPCQWGIPYTDNCTID